MEYAAPAGAGAGGYYYYPPSQQHKPRRPPRPAARWVKHWIPQDLATSSGKCALYKWVRGNLLFSSFNFPPKLFCVAQRSFVGQRAPKSFVKPKIVKAPISLGHLGAQILGISHFRGGFYKIPQKRFPGEKLKLVTLSFPLMRCGARGNGVTRNLKDGKAVPEPEAVKPVFFTEILFLCSYENCGKTFVDVAALRKHAHVHNERQYICQEPGCGKKFVDSSKLKRHHLIHTGQKDFICPHPGCGKAFSLDFNLRSHLKTHALENYHVCPFPACGQRFTSDSQLKSHVKGHEKLEISL
ncbi:hypothetical protein OsI_18121 [Oryza sativa Indica Group]|uniref:C2H2-type domain-containing protein n=1 Tax=Oryza sativa subsp. indica TaxID=39946 RepID=A2XZG8_ORYSI|nr:hypothetical protein OsI_18121 [Oryza sativa Indica Group]